MPDRVVPKQKRATETRDRILDAAVEVYAQHGRDYFSMQLVHKSVGGAIGTLYRYFGDRVSLLNAVEEEKAAELAERGVLASPGVGEVKVVVEVVKEVPVLDPQGAAALDAIAKIKDWCLRVIEKGEGQYDLKTAGEFMLGEIEKRNL